MRGIVIPKKIDKVLPNQKIALFLFSFKLGVVRSPSGHLKVAKTPLDDNQGRLDHSQVSSPSMSIRGGRAFQRKCFFFF